MRKLLQLLALVLLLAAPASAQVDTTATQSDRQLRQRQTFLISQITNSIEALNASLAHARISFDAVHARITRDSLRAVTPEPPPPPTPDTTQAPPPVPPDTASPTPPEPDTTSGPPAEAIVFESAWPVAGATNPARLSGGWDGAPSSNPSVLDVVPGSDVGWTRTPNVLRVTQRSADFYGFVEERNQIPQGVDYFARVFIRVGGPSGCNSQGSNHSVKADYLTIQHTFWALHNASAAACTYTPFFNITRTMGRRPGDGSGQSAQSQFHAPSVAQQVWYCFEFHVQVLDAERRFQVWPRIHDMAGNLVADADDYRQETGRTLREFYASGAYSQADSFDQLRRFAVGYEGTAGSQDRSENWYYGDVKVATDNWVGCR